MAPVINAGMGAKGISYRLLGDEDAPQVIQFLRRFFFKDEPLNIAVGLLDEPGSTCVELEQYCLDSLSEGVSLAAVSEDNEILAVCLNGILTRQDSEAQNDKMECANPRFRKILNLLNTVGRECDVFGLYPDVDRVLEVRVVSVADACRGQGIAKAIIEKSKSLAKEVGLPLVKIDCTSHFSALAVARLGFTCIYTLKYSDHLGEDGQPSLTPEPPHACAKTFVMPILS